MSNFHICPVRYERITFPSSEHAFQAAKTLNTAHRLEIKRNPEPRDAKKLGRRVELRPDWEKVKIDVMRKILEAKFTQNDPLAERLLLTEPHFLVEGNDWGDDFWGAISQPRYSNVKPSWVEHDGTIIVGYNWLGILLTDLRYRIEL